MAAEQVQRNITSPASLPWHADHSSLRLRMMVRSEQEQVPVRLRTTLNP